MEYFLRLPRERISVAIGHGGEVKEEIERRTGTKLALDSSTGVVRIKAGEDALKSLVAREVLSAIARGFSPERAFRLFGDDEYLEVIDISNYVGHSGRALVRIKGRVIGEGGKIRHAIEDLTEAHVSIYGKTVALIGTAEQLAVAREAIDRLLRGSRHSTVYRFLERKHREMKRNAIEAMARRAQT
jgi:ribosomal RNA assembly protein